MAESKLTKAQASMLSGPFYIDGWHNTSFQGEADALSEKGFLSRREARQDQYTAIHYEPTEAGRAALQLQGRSSNQ